MRAIVVSRKIVHTKDWVLFCNSQLVEGEEFSVQSSEFRERRADISPCCLRAVTHRQDVRHFNTDPDRKMVVFSCRSGFTPRLR